jgi:hypothetical protein
MPTLTDFAVRERLMGKVGAGDVGNNFDVINNFGIRSVVIARFCFAGSGGEALNVICANRTVEAYHKSLGQRELYAHHFWPSALLEPEDRT